MSGLLAAVAALLAVLALLNTVAGDPLGVGLWRKRLAWPAEEVPGPHVVIVLADTLRADHLGFHGYARDTSPHVDRFAAAGVRFTMARSNAPWTKPSVGTLLTGRHHESMGLTRLDSVLPTSVSTAFEVFGHAGYHTVLLNGGSPHITEDFAFTQGVVQNEYFPYADTREHWVAGRDTCGPVVARFLETLDASRAEPVFAYLHLMDPHLPYYAHSGNAYFGPGPGEAWQPGAITAPMVRASAEAVDETVRRGLVNLYDGQIRVMDACLAPLLARVTRTPAPDERRVLLVFTADHGEEFWEHGEFEHGHTMYDEQLHVPLVLGGNAMSARRVDTPVQLLDLLPTLLELADVEAPVSTFAGRSFAALVRGEALPPRPFHATSTLYGAEAKALIVGAHKLIERHPPDPTLLPLETPRSAGVELYDLERDPEERLDLAADEPGIVRLMERELVQRRAPDTARAVAEPRDAVLDPAARSQLEALGYLRPD